MNKKVIVEKGSLLRLEKILDNYPLGRVFLVTGKESFLKSGAKDKIELILTKYNYFRFYDFSENPKIEEAIYGAKLFLENKSDIIIAIGGGSAIDIAKSINAIVSNQNIAPIDLVRNCDLIDSIEIPLIAIPTTSGTGSEATHFAVIYSKGVKYSLSHKHLIPDYIILDSELTHSMSPLLTAQTGLDALCQAIESYWSKNATKESKKYATKAMNLLFSNIRHTVHKPNNPNRKEMMLGAYWAGKAINISKTTAPHAYSYFLTSEYGIAHGHAVALWMPLFLVINKVTIDDKMLEILQLHLSCDLNTGFKQLVSSINLESDLKRVIENYKIDVARMLTSVNSNRLKNNPIPVNSEDILKLLGEE